MPDFHIPNDPEWQWAYDAILYTTGGEFPEADPTALRAMGDELYAFTNTLLNGVASTSNLGNGLSAHLDGPAADAFNQFRGGIANNVPTAGNISWALGNAAYEFALDSESTQYNIVIAAFTQVVEIAFAIASGFGAAAVPALIKIGQEIVKTLIDFLRMRLQNQLLRLVWEGIEEGLEELWQGMAAQLTQMAEGNRKGFDYQDLALAFAGGFFIGMGVSGMHAIGGKLYPKINKNLYTRETLSALAETLFEGLFSMMVGGSFNPFATMSSSIIGGLAHQYAHDFGNQFGVDPNNLPSRPPPDPKKGSKRGNPPPTSVEGPPPPAYHDIGDSPPSYDQAGGSPPPHSETQGNPPPYNEVTGPSNAATGTPSSVGSSPVLGNPVTNGSHTSQPSDTERDGAPTPVTASDSAFQPGFAGVTLPGHSGAQVPAPATSPAGSLAANPSAPFATTPPATSPAEDVAPIATPTGADATLPATASGLPGLENTPLTTPAPIPADPTPATGPIPAADGTSIGGVALVGGVTPASLASTITDASQSAFATATSSPAPTSATVPTAANTPTPTVTSTPAVHTPTDQPANPSSTTTPDSPAPAPHLQAPTPPTPTSSASITAPPPTAGAATSPPHASSTLPPTTQTPTTSAHNITSLHPHAPNQSPTISTQTTQSSSPTETTDRLRAIPPPSQTPAAGLAVDASTITNTPPATSTTPDPAHSTDRADPHTTPHATDRPEVADDSQLMSFADPVAITRQAFAAAETLADQDKSGPRPDSLYTAVARQLQTDPVTLRQSTLHVGRENPGLNRLAHARRAAPHTHDQLVTAALATGPHPDANPASVQERTQLAAVHDTIAMATAAAAQVDLVVHSPDGTSQRFPLTGAKPRGTVEVIRTITRHGHVSHQPGRPDTEVTNLLPAPTTTTPNPPVSPRVPSGLAIAVPADRALEAVHDLRTTIEARSPDAVARPEPEAGRNEPPPLRDISPAVAARSTAETPTVGDPVDVTTGRVIYTETDIVLPGLHLERTHRSDYHWGRSFGPSWASTLDQRVITDESRAWFLAADGSILTYPMPGESEQALPLLGRPLPLRRLVGGGWTIMQHNALLLFTPTRDGREALLSDVATAGVRWHIVRDDDGTPTALESSSGHRVELHSRDGLVIGGTVVPAAEPGDEVELPTFGYDNRCRLVEVRNSSGDPTRLGYDADGRIVRWEDRNGEWYTYAYDEAGRCVLADGNGGYLRYTFEYSDDVTVVTDSLGGVRRYELNERRQVVAFVDQLGALTRLEWDAANRPLSRTDPLGRVTRSVYDEHGRLTAMTYPDGSTAGAPVVASKRNHAPLTAFDLDDLGRPRSTRLPDGTTTEFTWTAEGDLASRVGPDGSRQEWHYDGEGNLVESIDAVGRTVRIEYGPFDLPTARVDEAGNRTEYAYDTELRLIAVTNPAGQVWRYAYDVAGRLREEIDFDGHTQRYTRDAAGRLIAYTDSAGDTTYYAYDLLGRVIERRVGEAVTRLEYDSEGRIATVFSPDAVVRFERDEQGRVVEETINDRTVRTSYHAELGTVQERTTPSGRSSRWAFDAEGRPESLTTGQHTVRFGYDLTGREISRTVDDVLALRQTFDAAGRLSIQHVADSERHFRYDPAGRVTAIADSLDGERSFQADEVGRIHAVSMDGIPRERYDYDATGSLAGTGGDRWEFDGTMLVRSDDATYEYDGKGRLVSRLDTAGAWRFTWDSEDRMAQVVTPVGDRWRYRYDGFGRRIAKQRLDDDDLVLEEVDFAWSGDLMVEQSHRDANGTTFATSWEYRPESSVLVTQSDGDGLRTVVTDLIGTPTRLVAPNGSLSWWSRSDLWGREHSPAATPLRFPGQYFDAETGLHYNRFRFYDPATARYLSPDPLGLSGGPNPTAYVPDPLTVADPLGLTSCKVTQPSLDPLGDSSVRPVIPDGEPSQLSALATPPPPDALYGVPPAEQVVTAQPDGSRTIRHEPRPASPPALSTSTPSSSQHAHNWYADNVPAAPFNSMDISSPQLTLQSIERQMQPLPERNSQASLERSGTESPAAPARRRGRSIEDDADYVGAPSRDRTPSAGPQAWRASDTVRSALQQEAGPNSRWAPVQAAIREYQGLGREDLDERSIALNTIRGSLENWIEYHSRWDTRARTFNRRRIRNLDSIRQELNNLIRTEYDDINRRRSRPAAQQSVQIRGSRAGRQPEPAAYTPFGTPSPANLAELQREFRRVGSLPDGVQVQLHMTGLANYSRIRHEGLRPGASRGIGLPGGDGADHTFVYTLTGSLDATTTMVTSEAGPGPVGVITTGQGAARDVNYPGGASQHGNNIPPVRGYTQENPTYSFTFPATPETAQGIANFVNYHRDLAGRSPLSTDEAVHRVRAALFHRFRLHVADYMAIAAPAPATAAPTESDPSWETDPNYYTNPEAPTESDPNDDYYYDYARGPAGSQGDSDVSAERSGSSDAQWVSQDEISSLRDQVTPRVLKATTVFDVVEKQAKDPSIPQVVRESYRQAGLQVPDIAPIKPSLGARARDMAFDQRVLVAADGSRVQDYVLRLHLNPEDSRAAELFSPERREQLERSFSDFYNQKYRIGPENDQFNYTLEFVDTPAEAHRQVRVVSENRGTSQVVWSADTTTLDVVHEGAHYVGAFDEYALEGKDQLLDENGNPVRWVLKRHYAAPEASIMQTTDPADSPDLKQRHLDRISRVPAAAFQPDRGGPAAPEAAQQAPGPTDTSAVTDDVEPVGAPSRDRTPSAGPQAWRASDTVRSALQQEAGPNSRWAPVQAAIREYQGLGREDLDERSIALNTIRGSLENWIEYHSRWDTRARTFNRRRIRNLDSIRQELNNLIRTEYDDINRRRSRPAAQQSVQIRGSRAGRQPEPAAYTPFGTPSPANLAELQREFRRVGSLPDGVQVQLHMTGLANYSRIRHEGLRPGASRGIGLPGGDGADHTFVYTLTGSLDATTTMVTSEAGPGPVGVITTGQGAARDVNYPGGASQHGNNIPPVRGYTQENPTYSFTFPATPETAQGIANFVNYHRDLAGRSPLSTDEAVHRVRAALFHRFRLHVADYMAIAAPAPATAAPTESDPSWETDPNYYTNPEAPTESDPNDDYYYDYAHAPQHNRVPGGYTPSAPFVEVSPATVAKSSEETPTAGDPIDVTTGRMILTETDFVLPGLTLARTYRSDYYWGQSFGRSWASTLDQRVIVDGAYVRYLAADGSILTYALPAEGDAALPTVGRALPLRRLVGGGWLLTDPTSGRILVFAPANPTESLLTDVVVGDLRWSIARDNAGTPIELRSSAGARIGFSSVAGLVTVLWLPTRSGDLQASYQFGYDGERNLVSVVNSSGDAERFTYADGRIVRWDDRNGEWYTYVYDEAGRCVSTDGKGGYLRYQFEYQEGLTVVTDSLGAVRRYELNDRCQVVVEADAVGATTRTEWDSANRLRSRTDPLGRTTTYDYTSDGSSSTITRADGSQSTVAYDQRGRPTSWTDFDGSTRQRAFDTDGRVLAETDTAGEVVRFDRPVEDGPGTVIHAGPRAFARDATQLITSMTKGGTETRYQYDGLGRVIAIEDDHGMTRVGWTIEGELAWRENPDGSAEEFGYDGEGNLVESVDATGRRTYYEYGAFDLVTARIDDDGNRTEYAYDTELRLTTITDLDGRTWQFTYDSNGRMTGETDFDGRTQRYAYDAAGQLIEHTDAAGEVTHFTYDLLSRVVERRTGAAVTRLAYDAAGRVVSATDTDSEVRLKRDAIGRVVAETVNGRTVSSSYNEQFGGVIARTRPSGSLTQWSYDESGRPAVLAVNGQHLRFAYDGVGEVSRSWDAGLTIEREASQPTTLDDRPSKSGDVRYTLDALGRPVTRSDADGEWHLTWDHRDRLTDVTTPGGDHWHYQYDTFGRRIAKQRRSTKGSVLEETNFVWSGDLLVEQHHRGRGNKVSTTAWEYHPDAEHLVAQITDGTVYAVMTDEAGTPTEVVGTDGSRPDGQGGGIPLRSGSRYLDAETGLQYDRFRYYDPATGCFLPEPRTAPVPVS
ncbi:DUF6531 domain-containing protein [Salinispora arenicola]|uniref:DUF6531 domain-containing protein n=1 Tax=Salinispora arenicola TaxID=168697 RepID=UPI0003633936|nr:DUF6531 domain-containing protein [Salinispora arenicola]